MFASLALLTALVLGPLTSQASHSDLADPNDTRGPLDLRRVRMSANDTPRWSVYTWDSWRAKTIWDAGFIVIKYDTFGDSHFDYYALVRSDGGRLRASLHRDHVRKDDRQIRNLQVTRPSRSSARVQVPLGTMRFSEPGEFRWMVNSTWTSPRCGEATCLDRAPDAGAVEEPRPPVPTPTIITSPTSAPSESDR